MSRLPSIYDRLIQALGLLAGLLIALCALLISLDVVLRNLFYSTIAWLPDLVEHVLFFSTFAIAPWVLRQGAHVRVDIVLAALPPSLGRAMDRLSNLLGIVICLAFGYFGALATLDAIRIESVQYKTLAIPEWWLLIVIPISMLLLAIEFLLRFAREPGASALDQGY